MRLFGYALIGTIYRQWRLILANPQNIVLPILEPTVYLLIFGQVMMRLVPAMVFNGRTVDYLAFVVPGVMAMAAWHKGSNSNFGSH